MKTILTAPAGVGCYRTRSTEPGDCPRCGRPLVYREIQGRWYCRRRYLDPLWKVRKYPDGRVRFEDEAFEWLGNKLGLAPDDPRLEDIAIDLARAKKLVVLVTKRGKVFAMGKLEASNQDRSAE